MEALEGEPTGANDYSTCVCCGNNSRCIWGLVRTSRAALASYLVHWTLTRIRDHGANFDLIIGKWGDQATAPDRARVALEYRLLESRPAFMVIDDDLRPAASRELVGRALARAEVIGRPIAQQAFAIVNAVLA